MIIQKIRTVFLLLVVACGFTACSALYPDAYYNGQQPIKDNFALVFASTTADISWGSALITYIQLENVQTKKTLNLENRTCLITKNSPGMGGLFTQAFMSGDTPKEKIRVNNICGSLVVGEIEAGEYELKKLQIKSNNLAQGGLVDSITYVPSTKQTFNIIGNEIVYLGHIETWALDMRGNFTIRSASVLMNDNYEYDSNIFKQTYKMHEDSLIRDNAIILENKKL